MPTREEMTTWATLRGFDPELGYCVVYRFAAGNGDRLPDNLAELTRWGTAHGLRLSDGSWRCQLPSGWHYALATIPESWKQWWYTHASNVRAFTYQHPLETAAIAAGVYLVLMSRSVVSPPKMKKIPPIQVKELW